jgi:hypothetical protein
MFTVKTGVLRPPTAGARPGEEGEREEGLPCDSTGKEGGHETQCGERVPNPCCHHDPGLPGLCEQSELGTKASSREENKSNKSFLMYFSVNFMTKLKTSICEAHVFFFLRNTIQT